MGIGVMSPNADALCAGTLAQVLMYHAVWSGAAVERHHVNLGKHHACASALSPMSRSRYERGIARTVPLAAVWRAGDASFAGDITPMKVDRLVAGLTHPYWDNGEGFMAALPDKKIAA